jgi:hypothetical protein
MPLKQKTGHWPVFLLPENRLSGGIELQAAAAIEH